MIDLSLLANVPSVPEDALLFQMEYANGRLLYKPSDIWCSQEWNVYGDGTITSYMKYSASGQSEIKKAKMAEADFNDLRGLLTVFHKTISINTFMHYYIMTLFNEQGEKEHKFYGEILDTEDTTDLSKREIGQLRYLIALKNLIENTPGLEFPEYGPKADGHQGIML